MPIPTLLLPLLLIGSAPGGVVAQEPTVEQPADVRSSGREVITGDHVVEVGQVVDEILVVGGDLRILGQVTGDAVVIGGDLVVEPGGEVLGDAVVTGGELEVEGGVVRGEMRTIDGRGIDIAEEIQRAIGGTAVTERTADVRRDREPPFRTDVRERRGGRDDHPIRDGIGGIFSTLALALVLAGIGTALVFYARPYLETVSDTVRGATMRSAATGLAATFLALPAFVVLIVALAVSIIGIPLLLVAIPLYPLAIFAGLGFGLLAVAHAIGERTGEQTSHPLDLRYKNSYAYLYTGLAMLLMPLVAANLIGMTGFLGFIGVLLKVVTWTAIWVCCTVGLGAVILSRGGRRRTFVPTPPDVDFDADDLFDEQSKGGDHA